ncbi:hypothetical protein BG58_31380 [Caballeronia jiangsuensis]|nr:hypothetical protein BG58_31380 [Caballeronia jiangsuensis]
MDALTLLSSAGTAAIVSGVVGFLSTRATLRANYAKDRFDRLYPSLKDLRLKLYESQAQRASLSGKMHPSIEHSAEDSLNTISELTILLDTTHDLYIKERFIFDADLRTRLDERWNRYRLVSTARTYDPEDFEEVKRWGEQLVAGQECFDAFLEATESQLIRLRDL